MLAIGLMMLINGCSDNRASTVFRPVIEVPDSVMKSPGSADPGIVNRALPPLATRCLPGLSLAGSELRCEAAAVKRRLIAGGGEAGNLVT